MRSGRAPTKARERVSRLKRASIRAAGGVLCVHRFLGLDKSVLVYQHEGLTQMEDTAFIVVILFIIVLFVVLSQNFVLGRRVPNLC